MFTVDKVLDEIMQLDYSTREMLVEIVRKRQIEERRNVISANAKKAKREYTNRKLKSSLAVEVIKHLHSL